MCVCLLCYFVNTFLCWFFYKFIKDISPKPAVNASMCHRHTGAILHYRLQFHPVWARWNPKEFSENTSLNKCFHVTVWHDSYYHSSWMVGHCTCPMWHFWGIPWGFSVNGQDAWRECSWRSKNILSGCLLDVKWLKMSVSTVWVLTLPLLCAV